METLLPTINAETVHAHALQVLKHIGIGILGDKATDIIRSAIRDIDGIYEQEGRIRFRSRYVEHKIRELRNKRSQSPQPEQSIICSTHLASEATTVCVSQAGNNPFVDHQTGEKHLLNRGRAAHLAKFVDSFYEQGVRWRGCFEVHDVPEPLKQMAAFKIDAQLSRERYPQLTTAQSQLIFDRQIAMWEVIEQPFRHVIWPIEPLKLGGESLDLMLDLKDRANIVFYVSSYALAGLNAPIGVVDSFVQATATAIGAFLIVQAVAPEKTVGFRSWALPGIPLNCDSSDVKAPVAIETAWRLVEYQVNKYYGIGEPVLDLTDEPLLLLQTGCRVLGSAGRIGGIDGNLSYSRILADIERIRRAEKVLTACRTTADNSVLQIIKQGIAEKGIFTQLENTAQKWRDYYWFSKDYASSGLVGQEDLTIQIEDRVSNHNYHIEEDKRRELDNIYLSTIKALGISYQPKEFYGCIV